MSSKSMSLKARIKQYAKNNKITAQVVLQNYMFERFLERLSRSKYQNKFIIRGGILISNLVGLDTRSTMDLDTTLRDLLLTEEKIFKAINSICMIDVYDEVSFNIVSVTPIRKDAPYGGLCVRLDAVYDMIITPLSIDISAGDVMTPDAVPCEFGCLFDENLTISLWSYNIETIMAEKIETILSRGTLSTRPRDYYDIYILTTNQKYDKYLFWSALESTSEHRGSKEIIMPYEPILKRIQNSKDFKKQWIKYQNKFSYAKEIAYEDVIATIRIIMQNFIATA